SITAALFGAGFYTLNHWKLEATSRGLLLIGTLLVPLNFLVLAGLARDIDTGPLKIGTEIAALVLFGWLLHRATRILVSSPLNSAVSGIALPAALLVDAIVQLLGPRFLSGAADSGALFLPLALVPASAFAVSGGVLLTRARRLAQWSATE